MEFDISKVYTTVNAEELHEGDLVYVADSLAMLKRHIEDDNRVYYGPIKAIYKEDTAYRFKVDGKSYALAYLVERAPEKKWRPFKDINELKDVWKRKVNNSMVMSAILSLIWVKYKNSPNEEVFIIGFDNQNDEVYLIDNWVSLKTLFDKCTFLDGTPCGLQEE